MSARDRSRQKKMAGDAALHGTMACRAFQRDLRRDDRKQPPTTTTPVSECLTRTRRGFVAGDTAGRCEFTQLTASSRAGTRRWMLIQTALVPPELGPHDANSARDTHPAPRSSAVRVTSQSYCRSVSNAPGAFCSRWRSFWRIWWRSQDEWCWKSGRICIDQGLNDLRASRRQTARDRCPSASMA